MEGKAAEETKRKDMAPVYYLCTFATSLEFIFVLGEGRGTYEATLRVGLKDMARGQIKGHLHATSE